MLAAGTRSTLRLFRVVPLLLCAPRMPQKEPHKAHEAQKAQKKNSSSADQRNSFVLYVLYVPYVAKSGRTQSLLTGSTVRGEALKERSEGSWRSGRRRSGDVGGGGTVNLLSIPCRAAIY